MTPSTPMTQTQDFALLGAPDARVALYLPNRPLWPQADVCPQASDVPALIRHNGNHWRKIFSILAKLCSPASMRWQDYRDQAVLHKDEVICFSDSLLLDARWHLIAGKASWQRLGLDTANFMPLDTEGRVWVRDNILLTPYPDYRQFPNRTVDRVRALLNDER